MFLRPRTAKKNLEMCFSLPLPTQLPPLLPPPFPSHSIPIPPCPSYLPFNPTLPTLPLPPLCVSVCSLCWPVRVRCVRNRNACCHLGNDSYDRASSSTG